MPFIANTPESLITRSDSKNPATTCCGITSTGRPCRRPLTTTGATDSGSLSRFHLQCSQSAAPRCDRHANSPDERMYCWQHKGQSSLSKHSSSDRKTPSTIAGVCVARNSVDTLAERLQMLDANASCDAKDRKRAHWGQRSRPSLFCCFIQKHPKEVFVPAPRPKPQTTPVSTSSYSPKTGRQHARRPPAIPEAAKYLSLIPATIPPQTATALVAELTKPVSQMDEPGYIYMFWMIPESQQSALPTQAAQSLLVPLSRPLGGSERRASAVVVTSIACGRGTGQRKDNTYTNLLLKIGRANNIQRRLNEWKRQCGYSISLIRYYPYIPAISSGSALLPSRVPRKIPHSHKVERLIHIELAGMGLHVTNADKCAVCGRGHREWFRVEATRDAVAVVDGVIRRWCDWDEGR